MRYLKKFNEDLDNQFREELKDFCETNLVYLLDEGTEVNVDESHTMWNAKGHVIKIKFNEDKSWNEIKDHLIPFATRLNGKYEMMDTEVRIVFGDIMQCYNMTTTIQDIINDNLEADSLSFRYYTATLKLQISYIFIYITGYKQQK